jgi:hypothetical protein
LRGALLLGRGPGREAGDDRRLIDFLWIHGSRKPAALGISRE